MKQMGKENTKRQFLTILAIVFLGFLGISMPYLIFPVLFLNPAYSILPDTWGYTSQAVLLGVTLGAYPLGQFIGSPILGALSDDYGRKNVLSKSLWINALCNLLTGLALHWQLVSLLILSRFASGLMEGNIAIARAMASNLKTISKHSAFGKINAAASIAYLLGPFFGGLLGELSISTPFYCVCLLFLGLSGLSLLTLDDQASQEKRTIWQQFNLKARLTSLFKNRQLKFLMIISTTFTLAVDIFYEFGPVYLTAKWQLDPVQLVTYNAVLCVSLAIGNGWLAPFMGTFATPRQAVLGTIGSLALLLIALSLTNSSAVMLLLFFVIGLAIGIASTLLTVKISDSAPDSIQGEVMGVQISLRVLGDAIICFMGGFLLILSPKIVLILAALISGLSVFFYKKFKT